MTHWLTQAQIDDNEWKEKESLRTEIRRLRAMVLRAHAVSFSLFECYCPDHEDPNPIGVKRPWMFNAFWSNRAARLLRHWANAIEAGRL